MVWAMFKYGDKRQKSSLLQSDGSTSKREKHSVVNWTGLRAIPQFQRVIFKNTT
ncbi:hypothetical protein BC827DRAFT_1218850, partial [Russula dissimulans]